MIIKKDMAYSEFLIALDAYRFVPNVLSQCLDAIKDRNIKKKLKFDFDLISFGKLATLQRIKDDIQFLTLTFDVILLPDSETAHLLDEGYSSLRVSRFRRKVMNLNTADALRFVLEVKKSLERVVELFEQIRYEADEDEKKANISKTSGSLYNIADWYARRMSISDVEQVYLKPWTQIYAALKIDYDGLMYQKRLYQIKAAKQKRARR